MMKNTIARDRKINWRKTRKLRKLLSNQSKKMMGKKTNKSLLMLTKGIKLICGLQRLPLGFSLGTKITRDYLLRHLARG